MNDIPVQTDKSPLPGREKPIRVLNVVATMNRGGVETWLMTVLKNIDRERFQIDFLSTQKGHYDEEVRQWGSRVIECAPQNRPWRYALSLRKILRASGPYDVVHSHVEDYTGFVLAIAKWCGVRCRIAHSHVAYPAHLKTTFASGWASPRTYFIRTVSPWISKYATLGLAASRMAALDRFGPGWESDPRWRVFHCSIDCAPYHGPVDVTAIRRDLGIPPDSFVIGNIARMTVEKNHAFFLRVAAALARRVESARFLLVGDGAERTQIEKQALEAGLGTKVIFAGVRGDVPQILRGAMDVLLFPSIYEGLGLVLIEAQAAGLPCVISDTVPIEADLSRLITRMSLSESPERWADSIIKSRSCPADWKTEGSTAVEKSSFNIAISIPRLEQIYFECVNDL